MFVMRYVIDAPQVWKGSGSGDEDEEGAEASRDVGTLQKGPID